VPSAQCPVPACAVLLHSLHPDCQLSICQTTLLPSAQPRPTSAWDRLHPDVLARALPRNHDTLRKTSCLPARPGQARQGQGQAGQPEPQPESALYIFLPLSHRPRPRPETSPQGQAGQPEPEPESALSALSASLLACLLAGLLACFSKSYQFQGLPVPRPFPSMF